MDQWTTYRHRLRSAEFILKDGFSVVAPINCYLVLKLCIR